MGKNIVNSPSYIVPVELENKISLKTKKVVKANNKKQEKIKEIPEEERMEKVEQDKQTNEDVEEVVKEQ